MPASWPATLPQKYNQNGTTLALGDGRVMSETDTGPGKMRLRTSAVADILRASMTLSEAQKDILNTFFRTTLAMGSLPFDGPDPWGTTVLLRFAKDGAPAYTASGGDVYVASFVLEILP